MVEETLQEDTGSPVVVEVVETAGVEEAPTAEPDAEGWRVSGEGAGTFAAKAADGEEEPPTADPDAEGDAPAAGDGVFYIGNIGEGLNADWIKRVDGGLHQRADLAAHHTIMARYYEALGDPARAEHERRLALILQGEEIDDAAPLADTVETAIAPDAPAAKKKTTVSSIYGDDEEDDDKMVGWDDDDWGNEEDECPVEDEW